MTLFKEAADIKTSDQLNLPTPTPIYHNEVAQPTEIQKQMVQELSERAAKVHAGSVDASTDNMLKITSDGRKLGLDPRLIDPSFEDNPDTKLNRCVENVARIHAETAEDRLTQIIFCDLGVPHKAAEAAVEGEDADDAKDKKLIAEVESLEEECDFCVYDDIRDKLIAKGIPAEEIAYIHDAKTEQQKADLEQAKADLEATQADLESQRTALNGKTSELAQNISQTDASISAADAEIEANKAALIEANKAVDKAAAELDAALNAANQAYGNASIQCSLDFGRPLATYKYVSCYFGGNGHRGTDYAAPGGTEIYAVSGGVVTAAAYHYSWGYYVQVYHGKDDNGNTYSTLYAHMNSAPVVSVGQNVSKGQVLGYVGSTGNSTGNHLHLEMKVNNVLVNVMNYLS